MTPEQRRLEQEEKWQALKRIWDHLDEAEEGKRKIPDTLLDFRFGKLRSAALQLGEQSSLNVRLERTGEADASLSLTSDLFLLGDGEAKHCLWFLMEQAGMVMFTVKDNCVHAEFTYDLRGVE